MFLAVTIYSSLSFFIYIHSLLSGNVRSFPSHYSPEGSPVDPSQSRRATVTPGVASRFNTTIQGTPENALSPLDVSKALKQPRHRACADSHSEAGLAAQWCLPGGSWSTGGSRALRSASQPWLWRLAITWSSTSVPLYHKTENLSK